MRRDEDELVPLQLDARIVPLAFRLNAQVGLTLWAPPWEDAEGEICEEFLGRPTGKQIVLLSSSERLQEFISGPGAGAFAGHPARAGITRRSAIELRATVDDLVDLDEVYEIGGGEANSRSIEHLSHVLRVVFAVATTCHDTELGSYLATSIYSTLPDLDLPRRDRDIATWWTHVNEELVRSWEWIVSRIEMHVEWCGDFSQVDADAVFADSDHRPPASRSVDRSDNFGSGSQGYSALAIVAFVLVFVTAFGIPSIVCGELALREIRRTGKDGRGLARVALVLGYLEFVGLVAVVVTALLTAV